MIALTLGDVVVYGSYAIGAVLLLVGIILGLVFVSGARAIAQSDEGDA